MKLRTIAFYILTAILILAALLVSSWPGLVAICNGNSIPPFEPTLAILTITAIAVILYTKEAARSNHITEMILKQNRKQAKKEVMQKAFFELLRFLIDTRNMTTFKESITLRKSDGLQAYYAATQTLVKHIERFPNNHDFNRGFYEHIYIETCENYGAAFGHYFRSLYWMLRFIDNHCYKHEERLLYARLLRAQLSSAEYSLLVFNCLVDDYKGLKELVERYQLLHDVRFTDDIIEEIARKYFQPCAFDTIYDIESQMGD
jgi:hypothetical protein